MGKWLVLTLALLSLSEYISATSVICYHGTWSNYRHGRGKFAVGDVPANLCTHYIYAFVGLDSATSKVVSLDDWLDHGLKGFATAVGHKKTNPNLKVLVAIGGWNEGSIRYSAMAADPNRRAIFVASALAWVQANGFDGFDLDWEYPARRDSTNPADRENFSSLIKELHEAFSPHGLIVTAAVSATPSSVDISYDVPALSKYLEFINVMLYDFHGAWDFNAYHNAPLYNTAKLAGTEYADYSVDASIQGWLARGASPSKLAMGVPFYGRTYILSSSTNTAPGAPTTGNGGNGGPYTATSGFWGYNEIIEQFNAGGWTTAWDDEQQVPYAYKGNVWLTYDNEKSLALKVEYAKSLGLGAIMLWSLETEDFVGLSGSRYPLLKAINNELGLSPDNNPAPPESPAAPANPGENPAPATEGSATSSATPQPAAPTPASPNEDGADAADDSDDDTPCSAPGYYRNPTDCNAYYYCHPVNGAYVTTVLRCSAGLHYDSKTGICNYASFVNC